MKGRSARLRIIKKIIENHRIPSQEDLLGFLKKEGVQVTQATLSRDLKLLKVGKVSDGKSGYYYTLPGEDNIRETEKDYIKDFQRGFIGIEFSTNIAVIRTYPGHANSVALALDNFNLDEKIGTIAGDDTIMIIIREGFTQDDFLDSLKSKIPELEL
ncbi:arginine repressor [Spirochaeta cellobiosiphila]|uniref:arginine repressor n=1 Tax=Spirochaeta cellobiosiphila TaxID=504483 RepID=UPI000402B275|nr:ArgR family transcriptional regulator [Spirochaeta cellobiosiphila]